MKTQQATNLIRNVNAKQRLAADPNTSIWVQANAGTGKTKVLIDRLARLLLQGADPNKILALTFTKAAAAEMMSRLYDRFREWSALEAEKLRETLATLEGVNPADISSDMLLKARCLLGEVLEAQGGMRIETIHAFSQKLLARFPLEANLPPNTQLIDGIAETQAWANAVDTALLSLAETNPDIVDRLFDVSDHTYIADTIKSNRTDLEDILTAANNSPEEAVEALRAHINPASESVEEILQKALFGDAMPLDVIARLMTEMEALGTELGGYLKQFYTLLAGTMGTNDPLKRWDAYKKLAIRKPNLFTKTQDGKAGYEVFRIKGGEMGAEIIRVKALAEDITNRQIFEHTEAVYYFAYAIFTAYKAEKAKLGALDHADLIDKTLELFTQVSSADWILFKLDAHLEHILIDEAQDTSPRQWALINCLLEELHTNPSASGRPRTQFTVGDEKQSIYGFQGADPKSYFGARADFNADSFTDRMTVDFGTSFRSTPQILEFVDTVLDMRAEQNGVDIATDEDRPFIADSVKHEPFREHALGCVELWPALEKETQSSQDTDAPMNAWAPSGQMDLQPTLESRLAARVADKIGDMLEQGSAIEDNRTRTLRPCEPKDFLILVEKRKPMMFPLVYALKSRGIPVAGVDRLSLQEDIGAQDCLNLMRFILQPQDDLTLAEIIRGPFVGLMEDDIHLFPLAHARESSLWESLQTTDNPIFAPARMFLEACFERVHATPFDFLSWLLDDMGGWEKLMARLGLPCRDPINCLLDSALAFEASHVACLQGFVLHHETDTSAIKRVAAKDVNYIRIMSIHGAKGLEAPIVMLPFPPIERSGRSSSLKPYDGFPLWLNSTDTGMSQICDETLARQKAATANERFRLLYVAMTRARDQLYIFEGEHKKDNKAKEGSWTDLVRGAMSKLAIAENADGLLRYGDLPKNLGKAPPSQTSTTHELEFAPPAWLKANPSTQQPLNAVTPLENASELYRPFAKKEHASAARGTLIHALFEYLIPCPPEDREAVGALYINTLTDIDMSVASAALTQVLNILNMPELGYLFDIHTGQSEVPVFGEIPNTLGLSPFNGRIDRLVELDDSLIILDYKSDATPPSNPKDIPVAYVHQLARYKHILAAIYPETSIQTTILWTQNGLLTKMI